MTESCYLSDKDGSTKQKTGLQVQFFFMRPHDTFSHQRSFRSIRYKLRHPWCSFVTDFTPTNTCQTCCHRSLIVGCEEIMSLTTRQKGTDNRVKKCQVCAFVQVNIHTHLLGSPVQICPGLSHTAINHADPPGNGSVSHWLSQDCFCSLWLSFISYILAISTRFAWSRGWDVIQQ